VLGVDMHATRLVNFAAEDCASCSGQGRALTDRAAANLAMEKENSGLLNRPFTVLAVEATASQNRTACGRQTTAWFAWVLGGSGPNSFTDQ